MTKPANRQLSSKAQPVWAKLDRKTREAIQRDYPFKVDRDEAVYKLRLRGVEVDTLAEITGMNRNTIMKISDRVKKDRLFDLRTSLQTIRNQFEKFYRSAIYYIHDRD